MQSLARLAEGGVGGLGGNVGKFELDPAKRWRQWAGFPCLSRASGGGTRPRGGMLGGAASLAVEAQETSGRGCSVGCAGWAQEKGARAGGQFGSLEHLGDIYSPGRDEITISQCWRGAGGEGAGVLGPGAADSAPACPHPAPGHSLARLAHGDHA